MHTAKQKLLSWWKHFLEDSNLYIKKTDNIKTWNDALSGQDVCTPVNTAYAFLPGLPPASPPAQVRPAIPRSQQAVHLCSSKFLPQGERSFIMSACPFQCYIQGNVELLEDRKMRCNILYSFLSGLGQYTANPLQSSAYWTNRWMVLVKWRTIIKLYFKNFKTQKSTLCIYRMSKYTYNL